MSNHYVEYLKSTYNAGDPSSILGLERTSGEEIGYPLQYSWASLLVQMVKNPLVMQETWVQSLGWEDPLEDMATHFRILDWRIPRTEKATLYRVAQNQTRLKRLSTNTCSMLVP